MKTSRRHSIFHVSIINVNIGDAPRPSRSHPRIDHPETGANEIPKRPYRMIARAEAAEATGAAILDAARYAFGQLPFDHVTLNAVAAESGVTVQTVIRRYGSKEGLFEAVAKVERERITASRAVTEETDLATALHTLVDHYEADGDFVLHLVAQEHHSTLVREAVQEGRQVHREWVERHCRAAFAGTKGQKRERRVHAAIAATDLGTWKLLRRDLGVTRDEVELIMLTLLHGMGSA